MIQQAVSRMAYASTRHFAATDRDYYGTPREHIERVRRVMGGIELDPASCLEANMSFVNAERFYSEEDDGLSQSWASKSLFLNPPYSGNGCFLFSQKFAHECELGNIRQAIILVNAATDTRAFRNWFDHCDAMCFVNKRIQFLDPSGERSQTNNSKGQLFFYRGTRPRSSFFRSFRSIGRCVLTERGM